MLLMIVDYHLCNVPAQLLPPAHYIIHSASIDEIVVIPMKSKAHFVSAIPLLTTALFFCVVKMLPAQSPSTYWKRVASFSNTDLISVDCSDSTDCMMTAWLGIGTLATYVLHSTDGGRSWGKSFTDTAVYTPDLQGALFLYAIQHPTRDLVAVSADSGTILRSTDAGRTWHRNVIAGALNKGDRLSMVDDRYGIVSFRGPGTPVFTTSDGGATWRRAEIPVPTGNGWDSVPKLVMGIACNAPGCFNVIIKGPATHAIARSTDNGSSWRLTYPMVKPGFDSVVFGAMSFKYVDSLHGFAAGFSRSPMSSRFLFGTNDAGASWQVLDSGEVAPGEWPLEMSFSSPSTGVSGANAYIYSTTDGGATWNRDSCEGAPLGFGTLVATRGHPGLAAAGAGFVYLRTPLTAAAPSRDDRDERSVSVAWSRPDVLWVRVVDGEPYPLAITIDDLRGRRVLERRESGGASTADVRIDVGDLPSGLYAVRVAGGGHVHTTIVPIVR